MSTEDTDNLEGGGPEVVMAVYALIEEARGAGKHPAGVILPKRWYDTLQRYRATLGDVPEGMVDYLGRYELFGLEILVEPCSGARLWYRQLE